MPETVGRDLSLLLASFSLCNREPVRRFDSDARHCITEKKKRRPCVPSETEKPAEHRVDMQTMTTGPARTSAIVPWKPKEGQQYEHGSRNRR